MIVLGGVNPVLASKVCRSEGKNYPLIDHLLGGGESRKWFPTRLRPQGELRVL